MSWDGSLSHTGTCPSIKIFFKGFSLGTFLPHLQIRCTVSRKNLFCEGTQIVQPLSQTFSSGTILEHYWLSPKLALKSPSPWEKGLQFIFNWSYAAQYLASSHQDKLQSVCEKPMCAFLQYKQPFFFCGQGNYSVDPKPSVPAQCEKNEVATLPFHRSSPFCSWPGRSHCGWIGLRQHPRPQNGSP